MISRTDLNIQCSSTKEQETKLEQLEKALEASGVKSKIPLTVQDIKLSKDRINTLRNTYREGQLSSSHASSLVSQKEIKKSQSYEDDEKDTCDGSDTDSINDIKCKSIVSSRIATYECPNHEKKEQIQQWKNAVYSDDLDYKLTRQVTSSNATLQPKKTSVMEVNSTNTLQSTDNLICKLHSDINSLDHKNNQPSNVILGNKDVLKLLSNRHLANLNIKVEKSGDRHVNSVLASKTGIRSSFRSSKRNHKRNIRSYVSPHLQEEKGMSDSTVKENESESENSSFESNAIKDKSGELLHEMHDNDLSQRLLSSSPIERAPVMKKINSSGTRIKKDLEFRRTSVNRSDSVGAHRVTRKTSITRNAKPKSYKEILENEFTGRTPVVKLRKRNSRCSKNSEYRVSVTIKPSTVADLTNKFNSMSSKEETNKSTSLVNACQIKLYSSPRASFKRKYRHKGTKSSKESKKYSTEDDGHYLAVPICTKRSLSNSLSDLTVKDFIDDEDFNKTDEEKVCEKIKTALSSTKFMGETDESDEEVDRNSKKASPGKPLQPSLAETESFCQEQSLKNCSQEALSNPVPKLPQSSEPVDNHCKSSSIDSGILVDDEKLALNQKSNSTVEELEENVFLEENTFSEDNMQQLESLSSICEHGKDYLSLETIKSGDSGIASLPVGNSLQTENLVPLVSDEIFQDNTELEYHRTTNVNINDQESLPEFENTDETKIKNDNKIYSSLKAVVRNTMKSTKEKDTLRKEGKVRKRSPSKERKKWFLRSRSKERKISNDDIPKENKKDSISKNKERSLYEKWTFKRFKDKKENQITVEALQVVSSVTDNTCNTSAETSSESFSQVSQDQLRDKVQIPREPEENKNIIELKKLAKSKTLDGTEKNIPPPPKTPIPSPPLPFKRFFSRPKHKKENSGNLSDANTDTEDNVYENLSQNLKKSENQKKILEDEGIRPNPSFLWSSNSKKSKLQAEKSLSLLNLSYENNLQDESVRPGEYGKIKLPSIKPEESDSPNYTEINDQTKIDTQQLQYDGIGSSVSYDEIASPSSCGYDDIRPPSVLSGKTLSEGYDPVSPPKSEGEQYDDIGLVTATLAVVKEDQMDSICYAYDDIGSYNVSINSHSYEPICPPDDSSLSNCGNFEIQKKMAHFVNLGNEAPMDSDGSENGTHEVLSYELTEVHQQLQTTCREIEKLPRCRTLKKSQIISTPQELLQGLLQSSKFLESEETLLSFQLPGNKCKRRTRVSYPIRTPRSNWTQGYRRYIKAHPTVIRNSRCQMKPKKRPETPPVLRWHTSSPPVLQKKPSSASNSSYSSFSSNSSCRIAVTNEEQQVYVTSSSTIIICNGEDSGIYDEACASYYNASTASSSLTADYESAKIRSIYYEGDGDEFQEISCYVEGQDDENDDQNGHYEAIYEVINPTEKPDLTDDVTEFDDVDFDDSFDSDDGDDAYSRLQPSLSEEIYGDPYQYDRSGMDKKYDRSQSYQPHSMTKIAEAANIGMKRLRRNWSYTKQEVKTGISKIKKKSAFSPPADLKAAESSPSLPSCSSINDKSKSWSFKSHFRRKSSLGLPSDLSKLSLAPSENLKKDKDRPTFYLTLTLSSDSQEDDDEEAKRPKARRNTDGPTVQRRKSATASISSTNTSTSMETTSTCVKSRSSSHVPVRSVSSRSSGAPSRPKTAPPDPPIIKSSSIEDNSVDISKDALALRLNQILSSGPMYPKGRRILKSPESSGSDSSPPAVPAKSANTALRSSKYASIACNFSSESNLASDIINSVLCNTPQARYSVASSSSNGSSEGYIRPSDIASAPPPLPARPLSGNHSYKRHSTPALRFSESKSHLEIDKPPLEEPTYISSHFPDEPLYQFYTAKVERAALYQGESSEDDYEVINDGTLKPGSKLMRPTAMELVSPAYGRRTLWCELPEVTSSGILENITGQDRKIQEAMFEVMTSEASYLKSLEVLVTHFMNCPEFNSDDESIICKQESKVLFSDIFPVKKCSELFLADLEERWQESVQITKITDIILKHAESFNVYVKYCSNQIYQDRMLRKLKEQNPRFVEILTRLESSPICQSLAMHSFLMLPMQRITRLPLLFDAIFNRLEYGSSQWQECKEALAMLTKVVAECNEGARKMERMEEMLLVSRQLDFREVKAIPLISASRWLVKKGELTRLTWRENDAKLTFGRKISKHSLYFFLFSDLLVVTKKKSDDQHLVLDYCPRNMVQVLELENANRFPGRILEGHKNLLIMTMLHNHENKTVEMVLSCPVESDRSRWIEAVTPRTSENPDERIYEEWDCPQVQSIHPYTSMQPDELSLDISDVINVLKKTSDGWYQGERLRDGEKGWFPGNHTVEVASAHVRARNLRQRYRLLVISGSFIEKEKKERGTKEEKKKERRKTQPIKEIV